MVVEFQDQETGFLSYTIEISGTTLAGRSYDNTLSPPNTSFVSQTFNLDPGNYQLVITDNFNNSVTVDSIVIGVNNAPIDFDVAQSSPAVHMQANGEAAINNITTNGVSKQVTDYTYQLDGVAFNNFNGNIISGLSAGNHTLTLFDGNCQSANVAFTIYDTNCTANFKLTATAGAVQKNPPNLGSITVFASGGVSPYTFLMLDRTQDSATGINDSSYRFDNLDSGSYTITARDEWGCTADIISVIVPYCTAPLQTNRLVTPADYGTNNGSAKLFVSGGVAPYTFKLFNNNTYALIGTGTGDSTFTFNSLGFGNYRISYTDNYGCDLLSEQSPLCIDDSSNGKVGCIIDQLYFGIGNNCNPITDSLFVTQTDSTGGYISGNITGGYSPYNIRIYDSANTLVDSVFDINTSSFISTQKLNFGKYYVVVSDAINCTNRDSIVMIYIAPPPLYYITVGNDTTKYKNSDTIRICNQNTLSELRLYAYGKMNINAVTWTTNATTIVHTGANITTDSIPYSWNKLVVDNVTVNFGNSSIQVYVLSQPCDCAGVPYGSAYLQVCPDTTTCQIPVGGDVSIFGGTGCTTVSSVEQGYIEIDNDTVSGSSIASNLCSTNFLLPNKKVVSFTADQISYINTSSIAFNGKTLNYFYDTRGHKFINATVVTMYQGKNNTANAGSPVIVKNVGQAADFICFSCLDSAIANGAVPGLKKTTAALKSNPSVTYSVYDSIPDIDPSYLYRMQVTLANATVGTIVNGVTTTYNSTPNVIYCDTLKAEDTAMGGTLDRDTAFVPNSIHLDHVINMPNWTRKILSQIFSSIISQCTIDYINAGLDSLHANILYTTVTSEAVRETMEEDALAYYALFGAMYCTTDETSVEHTGSVNQFAGGMLHTLVSTIDVVKLASNLTTLVQKGSNYLDSGYQGFLSSTQSICTQMSNGTFSYNTFAQQLLDSTISGYNSASAAVSTIASHFAEMYFTGCDTFHFADGYVGDICDYRHGEVAMMALPIIVTGGTYAIEELGGLVTAYVANTEEAVTLINGAETAGNVVIDELDPVMQTDKTVIDDASKNVATTIKNEGTANSPLIVITEAADIIDDAKLAALNSEVPNSLFINNTKFVNSALKIDPQVSASLQTEVTTVITSGDATGTITEGIQDAVWTDAGYTVGDAKYGSNNGIDGFYYKGTITNPTEIVVCEAKQWGASGGVSVSAANAGTGLPIQMSDSWIDYVAGKLIGTGDTQKIAIGNMLRDPANLSKIQKYMTVVNKTTGDINVLKLGSY